MSGNKLQQRRPRKENPEVGRAMRRQIHACEWPGGCAEPRQYNPLTWAHIIKRSQMGDDVPSNTFILCLKHHSIFDRDYGKTADRVEFAKPALEARPDFIKRYLEEYE